MDEKTAAARARFGETIEKNLAKVRHQLTVAQSTQIMVQMVVDAAAESKDYTHKAEIDRQFQLTAGLADLEVRHAEEKLAFIEGMKTEFEAGATK